MIENTGFPFAPQYLQSLRLGPQSEDVVPVRRKVAKSGKPQFPSKGVSDDAKVKKSKSIKTPVVKHSFKSSAPAVAISKKKQPTPKQANNLSEYYVGKIQTPLSTAVTDERKFYSCGTSPSVLRFANCHHSLLMTLSKWEVKAISGFCTINLLKGSASVNGYGLRSAIDIEVTNPSWLPTVKLSHESMSSSSSSKSTSYLEVIKTVLRDKDLSIESNLTDPDFMQWVDDADCIVLVQGIPRNLQEWLIAAEDQSIYQGFSPPQISDDDAKNDKKSSSSRSKRWWTDVRTCGVDDVFGVTSAVVGDQYNISGLASIELMDYSSCWMNSVSEILDESSIKGCRGSRTVICGAKGVGKSTCLRYTVNRLLSTIDTVAVIDCDLGQPEFTVPGLLSLHIISGPILSPTHMHLREPLLSYFIGDITSKNEPEQFSNALKALMAKYTEIQSDLMKKSIQLTKNNENDANSFAMLSERKYIPKMVPLPLVVNTDGSVRFMGAEILTAVMEVVKPTHVLHISSEKDRDLPAVDRLKEIDINMNESANTSINGNPDHYSSDSNYVNSNTQHGDSSSSNRGNSKRRINQGSSNDDRKTDKPPGCRVFTLMPGRSKPSKIASADLRTLRIVSYFLRGESSLRERVRPPLPPPERPKVTISDNTYMPKPSTVPSPGIPGNCLGDSNGSDVQNTLDESGIGEDCYDGGSSVRSAGVSAEIKLSKKAIGANAPTGLFITKGALVDWRGALALTVMGLYPLRVNFSEVVFEVLSMSVAPRLILAAMNASLVGIVCCSPSDSLKKVTLSSTFDGCCNVDHAEDDVFACTVVRGNEGAQHDTEDDDVESESVDPGEFQIQYRVSDGYAGGGILPECIGLGIVRAIDVQKQLLYVITPLLPAKLNNLKCGISLVRGPLQLPGVMTYAPDVMPLHPYLSSEITGEGSAVMKTRNNLKRRSLQN